MTVAYAHCLYRNPTKMLMAPSDIFGALRAGEPIEFGRYTLELGGGTTLACLSFTRTGAVVMEGGLSTQTIQADKVDPLCGNVYDVWIALTKAVRRDHTIRDLNNSGLTKEQATQFADAAAKLAESEQLRGEALAVLDPITAVVGQRRNNARLLTHMAEHLPPGNDVRALLEVLSERARKPRPVSA